MSRRNASPKVSVIVPCYNQGDLLSRALESIVSQSHTDWELIIVDDGSTDDTSDVAREFAGKYPSLPIVTIRQPNGGLSKARNSGINICRGEYVVCLDSDDWLESNALELMTRALDRAPDAAVASCNMEYFEEQTGVREYPDYEFSRLIVRNLRPYCSMYRRSAWVQVDGYDEGMTGYEDWEFWISVGKLGHSAVHIPRPLLHYRRYYTGLRSMAAARELELRSWIVRNHPDVYDQECQELAAHLLAGAKFDRDLLRCAHPIFSQAPGVDQSTQS